MSLGDAHGDILLVYIIFGSSKFPSLLRPQRSLAVETSVGWPVHQQWASFRYNTSDIESYVGRVGKPQPTHFFARPVGLC